MKVKIPVLSICFLLFHSFSVPVLAQLDPDKKLNEYTLETWTVEDGLPSSTLIDIHQSKDGYLWITSFQGLIRFDGKKFKVFDKRNVDVLLTNSVVCIQEDTQGTLWLGAEGSGLLSYKDGKFYKHQQEEFHLFIKSILIDEKRNQIWVGTTNRGLYVYDYKKFRHIDYEPLNNVTVISLAMDKEGVIWASTEGKGISRFENNQWSAFTEKDGLLNNDGISLFVDHENILWISTISGLCSFDGKKFKAIPGLKGYEINAVLKDNLNHLYVASQNGLCRINNNTGQADWLQEKDGLPNQELDDLIFDTEGNLWTVTYRGGLCKLKNGKFTNYTMQDGLSSRAISVIHEPDSGRFLVGGNYGIVNMIANGEVSDFHIKTSLIKDRIFGINSDKHKNLWISTYGGLLRIKPNGKEDLYTKSTGLPSHKIMLTYTDKKGVLWVGTRTGGLLKIENLNADQELPFQVFNQKKGLSSDFIMSIDEDLEGNLIVGTNTGGISIISDDKIVKHITRAQGLISNLVFNTYVDSENVIWIVTNGGLSRLKNNKSFNYTTLDGLPNDSPFDFMEDKFGHVWMPSSIGLIKVDKQELNDYADGKIQKINWKVFDSNDGMKNSECTGATQALKAKDGSLWIPTFDGVSVIEPKNILSNSHKPPVYIEALLIDGKSVDINKKIEIAADKQRLLFQFTGLSFKAPLKNQFKYKLENFDNDWISVGNAHEAVYTKLEPNDYIFKVIASNNDGVWNEVGDTISFSVLPVWWLTWWAKVLFTFLFFLIIISLYLFRVNVLKRQKRLLEYEVKMRTSEIVQQKEEIELQSEKLKSSNEKLVALDKFKEAMTGMIVHDLKNPLNTIMSFSTKIPDETRTKKIHEAGKLILNMTYDLLDVQKFEEAKAKLNKDTFPIFTLIRLAIDQVSFLKDEKEQEISYDIEKNACGYFDCDLILRVIINILTNAIKYTPVNGKIHIDVKSQGEDLKFNISDNGVGIPKEKVDLVFDKYAQIEAKKTGNVRSTGIGLTFCKLAVEAHGGQIGVTSEEGEGSSFWFILEKAKLPVHLEEEELVAELVEIPSESPVALNAEDKKSLEPYITELLQWEVFDFSEVNDILVGLESQNQPAIQAWLKEMKNAVQSMNQEKYSKLLVIESQP